MDAAICDDGGARRQDDGGDQPVDAEAILRRTGDSVALEGWKADAKGGD